MNDDYKTLMRLAYAHHRCTRRALDFDGACAVARDILAGDLALVGRTAERVERMPFGVNHHPQMLEEVASNTVGVGCGVRAPSPEASASM